MWWSWSDTFWTFSLERWYVGYIVFIFLFTLIFVFCFNDFYFFFIFFFWIFLTFFLCSIGRISITHTYLLLFDYLFGKVEQSKEDVGASSFFHYNKLCTYVKVNPYINTCYCTEVISREIFSEWKPEFLLYIDFITK